MQRRMLALFAHPDDEGFGCGGTIALSADQGVRVTLVSATRGESGEIADDSLASPENLGQVREEELRCAARALGIAELIFLDYRDSGMPGALDNEHPRAFMHAEAEDVVPRLVEIIRRARPQVVLTFDPGGAYGHPDHIAIHRHALAAVTAAGDPQAYPELGSAWQTGRVFYSVITRAFFTAIRDRLRSHGEDVEDFQAPGGGPLGFPDDQVDLCLDVKPVVNVKWEALHCHRTQMNAQSVFFRLPEDEMKALMRWEYFVSGRPEGSTRELTGLFEGLDEIEEVR